MIIFTLKKYQDRIENHINPLTYRCEMDKHNEFRILSHTNKHSHKNNFPDHFQKQLCYFRTACAKNSELYFFLRKPNICLFIWKQFIVLQVLALTTDLCYSFAHSCFCMCCCKTNHCLQRPSGNWHRLFIKKITQ